VQKKEELLCSSQSKKNVFAIGLIQMTLMIHIVNTLEASAEKDCSKLTLTRTHLAARATTTDAKQAGHLFTIASLWARFKYLSQMLLQRILSPSRVLRQANVVAIKRWLRNLYQKTMSIISPNKNSRQALFARASKRITAIFLTSRIKCTPHHT
jgi:hypothetical protein